MPGNFIGTSSDTLICEVTPSQEEIAPSVPKTKLVRRRPACAPVPLSVSYPVLRCLAQRIFISMYQSSIKVSEVKEEAVQPSTTKNDYPSADDRTADNRTTINNSNCEAGPGEGEKLATLTEDPPPPPTSAVVSV